MWVVKLNKKYLEKNYIDPVWTKDIMKAILYDRKPILNPLEKDEKAVRVEVKTSIKEI